MHLSMQVPLLYRYEARGRSRGVDIGFVSMYPKEKEFLYAPLTGLILLKMHEKSEAELRALQDLSVGPPHHVWRWLYMYLYKFTYIYVDR